MRGMRRRPLSIRVGVIAIALASGCATHSFESSAPAPGVPRISNLRIDPAEAENGKQATLRFDFADLEGDIVDVHLGVSAEIKDFTLATGLRSVVISRGRYLGQTRGTAEETVKITMDPPPRPLAQREFDTPMASPEIRRGDTGGIRVYKVFVVDQRGQVSNALRGRVTIHPSSASIRDGPYASHNAAVVFRMASTEREVAR